MNNRRSFVERAIDKMVVIETNGCDAGTMTGAELWRDGFLLRIASHE